MHHFGGQQYVEGKMSLERYSGLSVVKYQKTKVQDIIIGWRVFSSSLLCERYKYRGDPPYGRKINFTLDRVRDVKGASCPT
ncbi:hypothetical protein [Massilia genomosp. 1]|uniref:Uncharacterized protein n=1 Tax=Massilia genomosp. 1 TaxID=2609280 RepID=A0ABX0MZT0_9BURK|nr:hypothetical protein [Massilia genomosp. 1]NHZ63369.1 hypothetical protein [Massilia genomosp. 1]